MLRWAPRVRTLGFSLLAMTAVGCGNPLTVATWLNLAPGSEIEAAGSATPIEGGVFARIAVDLSDLLNIRGTIEVDQVRIAGRGGMFGTLCLRKDLENAVPGSFHIDVLRNTQTVDFPLATIAFSSSLKLLGFGEIATVASPEGLAFPTDLAVFQPLLDTGSIDGVLNLPVVLEQDFELDPAFIIPAVVNLALVSAGRPPSFSDPVLPELCKRRWARQGEPLVYMINPKGTYLHHVNEANPQQPLIIDLAEVGAVPGDTLRIATGGKWDGFFQSGQRRVVAVFSATDVLRPVSPPAMWTVNFWHWLYFSSNRVAGALDAGLDVVTPLSFGWLNRTDIPEDFEITGEVEVVVPEGAHHLFVSPVDIAYSDNIAADLRVSIEVATP